MKKKPKDKHPVEKIRKPMPPPTRVKPNPKAEEEKKACRKKVVQETFLRGYRAWHRYTPGTRARSWLFTICRNAFLRQRARESRRSELAQSSRCELVANAHGVEHSAHTPMPDAVVATGILRRIRKLPPEFGTVVLLCDLHSIAYADAARHLGIPLGTLKSRLHRARRILKHELRAAAAEHGLSP
jgi:RNA polymerase sigma-70 factor (ECF subfamily)